MLLSIYLGEVSVKSGDITSHSEGILIVWISVVVPSKDVSAIHDQERSWNSLGTEFSFKQS